MLADQRTSSEDATGTAPLLIPGQPAHQPRTSARRLVERFNTWAFKREQPCDPQRLLEFVDSKIGRHQPLSFVLYWGKGPRDEIATPDMECLAYLEKFRERITSGYPLGCEMVLCLTDTHARHNGHTEASMRSYFSTVRQAAVERGFETELLSDLVLQNAEADGGETISDVALEDLKQSAEKWYRGPASAEDGAREYLAMNMIERQAVEYAHPESVFITYNSSRFRGLFPESLPVFYMYSLRKGTSVKPWFLDALGNAYDGAEDGELRTKTECPS